VAVIRGMAVDNGAAVVHLFRADVAPPRPTRRLVRRGGRVVALLNRELMD
jgi:hypothetical protein